MRLFLYRSRSSRGRENAAVLPEPTVHTFPVNPGESYTQDAAVQLFAARVQCTTSHVDDSALEPRCRCSHGMLMCCIDNWEASLEVYGGDALTCDGAATDVSASQSKRYTGRLQCIKSIFSAAMASPANPGRLAEINLS